jgi:hypothetical protein
MPVTPKNSKMLATLFKNLRFKMVLVYPFLMGFHLLEKVHAGQLTIRIFWLPS